MNIELKYYNHQNEYIAHEYHDHIYKLLIINFNFQLKLQHTENLVHDIDYLHVDMGVNVAYITNYENYFDKDVVSKNNIFNLILEFKKYYNQKKIEVLYSFR